MLPAEELSMGLESSLATSPYFWAGLAPHPPRAIQVPEEGVSARLCSGACRGPHQQGCPTHSLSPPCLLVATVSHLHPIIRASGSKQTRHPTDNQHEHFLCPAISRSFLRMPYPSSYTPHACQDGEALPQDAEIDVAQLFLWTRPHAHAYAHAHAHAYTHAHAQRSRRDMAQAWAWA